MGDGWAMGEPGGRVEEGREMRKGGWVSVERVRGGGRANAMMHGEKGVRMKKSSVHNVGQTWF